MLGIVSKKGRDFVYLAEWRAKDKSECQYFRFAIVSDDNLEIQSNNYMKGYTGAMQIKTKSTICFKPEDVVVIRGYRYTILNVDGNRKEEGEQAQARFENNGNVPVYLSLRKAGL